MTRPTFAHIDTNALLHNLQRIKCLAPQKKIIAMVKANAYGCGLSSVLPVIDGHVDAFGVASLEEAIIIRRLGSRSECILFQGVFSAEELDLVASLNLQCVIHHAEQLQWLLRRALPHKIKVWLKVNTGMHRLGFQPNEVYDISTTLQNCSWINDEIGIMTHLACADEPSHIKNQQQLAQFTALKLPAGNFIRSIANSAAILAIPDSHADIVRPGIMLYGVSPFPEKIGRDLGLIPVMRFVSAISAIHHYPAGSEIGYGARWSSDKPIVIGVVAVGYGDGYPRHITSDTTVWVNGYYAPIVGRVSMDMMTINLTHCPGVVVGDIVELWGQHIPVERIAQAAGTIAYELICQVSPRARNHPLVF
ncbi:MAG: alanine racemase [Legionella sp.]